MATQPIRSFDDINAVLRQMPLPEFARVVAGEAGGLENYEKLRSQGMNDLDIVSQYVEYPKISYDLSAMYDTYNNDPRQVAREIAGYAGVDYDDIASQQGFTPERLIKFFAEGRDLTTGEAALEGLGRGATVGAPAAASAAVGAQLGLPFGLPGILGGGALFGLAGGIGGVKLEEQIFPESPILNPNARATMEGVKTGTEALAFLSQPWAFSRLSRKAFSTDPGGGFFVQNMRRARDADILKEFKKVNGRYPTANELMTKRANYKDSPLGRFMLAAERNPKTFYGLELAGVIGSGGGAFISERTAPGAEGNRFAWEVGGSLAGQSFMVIPSIYQAAKDRLSKFSKSATESRAAEGLVELLESYDENPEKIIQLLRQGRQQPGPGDPPLSPDEKTIQALYEEFLNAYQPDERVLARLAGFEVDLQQPAPALSESTAGDVADSFVLRILEKSVLDGSPQGAPLVRQRAQNNVENLQKLLTMLAVSGDPDAIREAAALRQTIFTDLVAARLQTASNQAQRAIDKLNVNDPDAGTKASNMIQKLVDDAYSDIRAQENALYNAFNGNFIVPTTNTQRAVQEIVDQFPDIINNPKDYFAPEILPLLSALTGNDARQTKMFIADLMASGRDLETIGSVAKTTGADPNTLAIVRVGDVPDAVLEKLSPNMRNKLNRLDEVLVEQEGLEDLVARMAPPEDVSGAILSPTTREYRQHFESLAEEFPDQFASGLKALQQYEAATRRLATIDKDILDNAVTAGDVLPIAQSIPEPDPVTGNDLNKLRGILLDQANDAMSGEKPNRILAKQYGDLQRAILQDFDDVEAIRRANLSPDTAAQGMLSGAAVIPELTKLKKARDFTRAKSDAFERAFPGTVQRDRRTGAPFIEPDLLRTKILGGGGDPTRLRMDQLRNAVGFLAEQGIVDIDAEEAASIAANITSLRDAEDVMLRLMVRDQTNEATGDVSKAGLQKQIIQKYARALDLFPDLKADLQDSVRTQYRLEELQKAADSAKSELGQVTQLVNKYSTNLIGDNILGALDQALNSPQPSKAVPNLIRHLQQAIPKYETRIGGESTFLPGGVRAVRRGDFEVEDVNRALKAAFFDKAKIYAGGTDPEGINFEQYKKFFFSPGPSQSKPVVRSLIETGVMTQDEASRLNALLTKAATIQNKLLDKNQSDVVGELAGAEDVLSDLVLRLTGAEFGATVGRAIPGRGSGQGLIQAQAGSQFARKLLGGVPLGNLREILDAASREPQLMARLLEKGIDRKTVRERRRFANGFAAALRASGLTTTAEYVLESLQQEPEGQLPEEGQARFPLPDPQNLQRFTQTTPQPTQAPAAPPIAPLVAAAPMPMPPMPAPPPTAQGPQQQMQRQRFAQAYPFDPVSDVIRSQGIGGLI